MRLIYLTLAWAAGIVLADRLPGITRSTWLVLAFGLLVAVVLFARPRTPYRLALIALLLFGLGGLRYALYPMTSPVTDFNNTGGLTITGIIEADPDIRDTEIQVQVTVESVTRGSDVLPSEGRVLVRAPRTADLRYGDRITATGILRTPAEYDTFSYADYLARSGVFSIMGNATVAVEARGNGSSFFSTLYRLRQSAADRIGQYLPEPQAGLLTGILLGIESGISPELGEAFSAAGAAHVIAISGFNMAVVSGFVMLVLNRVTRRPWLAAWMGIAVLVVYTLFVGANAAVVRAAVMSSLLIVGGALQRKTFVPTSLAFVALVMSALNPTVLWDISFQLSFLATLGLALFADPLQKRFDALLHRLLPETWSKVVGGVLAEPLVVTTASLITTLPLTLIYFNRLSLVVLLVNLLIVPVQTWLLFLGIGATVTAFIVPALAQIVFWLVMVLLSWTIGVVRLFAALPFAQIDFTLDPRLMVGLLVVLIGWALMEAAQPRWWLWLGAWLRGRAVVTTAVFASVGIVVLSAGVVFSRPDDRLHVWMLDVGHSSAVLMQSPGGAHLLVDGGRYPSRLLTAIGDRLPFNDREIEILFITEPSEYQIEALPAVLARYETDLVLTNGQPNESASFTALQTALAGREVLPVTAGHTLELDDGTRVEVLHPQITPDLATPSGDAPLVLRVSYGEISFLLTSQLNPDGQVALLDAGQHPLATVLQLPRQGTARSLDEGFLVAVQPQVVLLQSDSANLLGDPNPDTLALLGSTPLYRTDEGGTLHLWTDGAELWVEASR